MIEWKIKYLFEFRYLVLCKDFHTTRMANKRTVRLMLSDSLSLWIPAIPGALQAFCQPYTQPFTGAQVYSPQDIVIYLWSSVSLRYLYSPVIFWNLAIYFLLCPTSIKPAHLRLPILIRICLVFFFIYRLLGRQTSL